MLIIKQHEKMENSTIKFEAGKVYIMSWIGDSELKTPFEMVSRTAKFVTLKDIRTNEIIRCKVEIYDGCEQCSPTGKYSMSPVLRASKVKPESVEHNGFSIIPSTRLAGWFMTECGTVCGQSIDEVKHDIDNSAKYAVVESEMAAMAEIESKRLAPIIQLFR
jgi:hypothetical protein